MDFILPAGWPKSSAIDPGFAPFAPETAWDTGYFLSIE
jgi:hypothetical protein